MNTIKRDLVIASTFLFLSTIHAPALTGVGIGVQATNIVLNWPSTNGRIYLIEYEKALTGDVHWGELANYFPAATGTNVTEFVHTNVIPVPSGGSGNESGSGNPPNPSVALGRAASRSARTSVPMALPADGAGTAVPLAIYPPGFDLSGFIIFDPATGESVSGNGYTVNPAAATPDGIQPMGHEDSSDTQVDCGFYRVFDVTPVPHDDFFGIDQDSSDDQLDIFQNDYIPNDDALYVSHLIPAHHGDISYSLDASTFQYTPEPGFYGVDSFGYRVTSNYGDDSATAMVMVFVNQTGNSPPVAPDILITLETNFYTATFNALTNASDPDGDASILFAVSSPNLGTVSTNTAGDITYTRNPNLFGDDMFTYTVTDGRGGYGICNVRILQQDSDGDGMPDQWEMASGLDPATDDSMSDPDNDGLPNFAEFTLKTNPNAPDNPLNFSSVTNGAIISDFAQLPIYGLSPALQNPPITLYVNGTPAENSMLWQGPDGQWFVNWDTTFLTNGSYQLQLACQINPPTLPDSVTNLLGSQRTVQIYNPITFDRLTSQFTDFLLLNGTLAETNDTYDAYLYDDSGNLLVYAAGLSASDGQISLYWDLTDGNGNQISVGNVQAVIYLHPPANPDELHANEATDPEPIFHWLLKAGPHVDGNVFAVAWGYDNYLGAFENYRNEMMQDGVVNILGNLADASPYTLLPAANIPYGGNVFRYDNEFDRSVLIDINARHKDDFNKSGNFFWFGHGGEIGDDFICGNAKKSNITANDVEGDLQNKAARSTKKVPRVNKHPYCLTILNACDTYTPGWSSAFGVDFSANGTPNSTADYANVGRPTCAFVGWTKKIGIPGGNDLAFEGVLDAQYGNAWGTAYAYWMAGYPLDFCMNEFSLTALTYQPILFINADSWKISGCHDMEKGDP